MPVYDYSYKTWEGERRGPLFRWLAIPKFTYMEMMKLRLFVSLLTVVAVMFVVRLVYIYLFINESLMDLIPKEALAILPKIDAVWFKKSIDYQFPFCFAMAFILGAGLISRDLKNNAVVLYASKPISRWEYFLGKFSVLFFIFMALLGIVPLFLFAIQTLVAPVQSQWHLYFWLRYAKIGPALLVYGFVASTTLSLLMMACSSLTENGRYAGIAFAVFIIGTMIVGPILADYLRSGYPLAISPFYSGIALGDYLFGLTPDAIVRDLRVGPWSAWIGILSYWIICGWILNYRVSRRARYGR